MKKMIAENRELIQQFTGISDENYQKFFFDTAILWAENQCEDPTDLTSQDMFWGWWAVEYSKAEGCFLECIHMDSQCKHYLLIQCRNGKMKEYRPQFIAVLYGEFMSDFMLGIQNKNILELSFHNALKSK